MNLLVDALAWISDPQNWQGSSGIPVRLTQHLAITAVTVLCASLIAIPAGLLIGHTRKGSGLIGGVTGAARAIPTLGVLTLVGLVVGIGAVAPVIALVVLAIPSLLAGAYAGVQAVNRELPQAAKAIGMSSSQVLLRVELPLALPIIIGGFRAAVLQVIATATLAAYVADLGLGRYLFAGLKSRDYAEMLGGSLLVALLALTAELLLAGLQHLAKRRFALSV